MPPHPRFLPLGPGSQSQNLPINKKSFKPLVVETNTFIAGQNCAEHPSTDTVHNRPGIWVLTVGGSLIVLALSQMWIRGLRPTSPKSLASVLLTIERKKYRNAQNGKIMKNKTQSYPILLPFFFHFS